MFRLGADLKVYLHRQPIDSGPASTALRFWPRKRWRSIHLRLRFLRSAIAVATG